MQLKHNNDQFIECWNDILVPKWDEFRHLLSGNGKVHSDEAFRSMSLKENSRVLDIGCGYGETALEFAGEKWKAEYTLGIDCTESFLKTAEKERIEADIENVVFTLGDAQSITLPQNEFDLAFSRFGIMFFRSPLNALKNMYNSLKPGGQTLFIVWRTLRENRCWNIGKEAALKFLPAVDKPSQTCGPGPFSLGNKDTLNLLMELGDFRDIQIKKIDKEICMGESLEEAVNFQLKVGPSGEMIRESKCSLETIEQIRSELMRMLLSYRRENGKIYMPSSSWAIYGKK